MTFLAPGWIKTRRSEAAVSETATHQAAIKDAPLATPLDAARLYELHLDEVFRYAARRLARREDAEDACAETFAAAFEALPKFRGETAPRLWLLGIARRKVADALRRRAARREIEWPPELDFSDENRHSSPPRALLAGENRRQMRDLLATLRDEQREALLLKYVEELSVEEIAVVMNRSKAAANSLLQRARVAAFKGGEAYFLDFQADSNAAPDTAPDSNDEVKS